MPATRIDFRDRVLAYGGRCIAPLTEAATSRPELGASVASWLEVLAHRDPETRPAVLRALTRIAGTSESPIARGAIERLSGRAGGAASKGPRKTTKVRRAAEAEVRARIIKAAREGRIVVYSDLETSRGHIGRYLFNISRDEAELGHPPLTSIVVSKSTGRPGDGFLPAMLEIGFAERGEPLETVWRRAVAAVHAFWAARGPDAEDRASE